MEAGRDMVEVTMMHDKQSEKHRAFVERQRAKGVYHEPPPKPKRRKRDAASRAEQQARYIDCGPQAWDDVGSSPDW